MSYTSPPRHRGRRDQDAEELQPRCDERSAVSLTRKTFPRFIAGLLIVIGVVGFLGWKFYLVPQQEKHTHIDATVRDPRPTPPTICAHGAEQVTQLVRVLRWLARKTEHRNHVES